MANARCDVESCARGGRTSRAHPRGAQLLHGRPRSHRARNCRHHGRPGVDDAVSNGLTSAGSWWRNPYRHTGTLDFARDTRGAAGVCGGVVSDGRCCVVDAHPAPGRARSATSARTHVGVVCSGHFRGCVARTGLASGSARLRRLRSRRNRRRGGRSTDRALPTGGCSCQWTRSRVRPHGARSLAYRCARGD